jgi:hypothetical protein
LIERDEMMGSSIVNGLPEESLGAFASLRDNQMKPNPPLLVL